MNSSIKNMLSLRDTCKAAEQNELLYIFQKLTFSNFYTNPGETCQKKNCFIFVFAQNMRIFNIWCFTKLYISKTFFQNSL